MSGGAQAALRIAQDIREEISDALLHQDGGIAATGEYPVPLTIVRRTRGYIEAVANQANGCYENGWFDACFAMLRKLIETLIIECYEQNGIAGQIKNANGDFLDFDELAKRVVSEPTWNLGRDAKRCLPLVRSDGNLAVHSRRYVAKRSDVDAIAHGIRVLVQELIFISKFR